MKYRVCVLGSSYENSQSELKPFESSCTQNPIYYFSDSSPFSLDYFPIDKSTAYQSIRDLVQKGMYDIFFNLCDGAKDEDRAGVEVVQALEEFNVPYTGACSAYYELDKPTMKMIAYYMGISTPNFVVLEPSDDVQAACASLKFPLLVKHISGYSSIGLEKSNKCFTMDELVIKSSSFLKKYGFALVEEFVHGEEVTVLVCADDNSEGGVRVFAPVQVKFPPNEDFKHFHLKWEAYDGITCSILNSNHPLLDEIYRVTTLAFQKMMGGKGYGRVDLRIDRFANKVMFLEINPNCGIMYPPGEEGSADIILKLDPNSSHQEFAVLQLMQELRSHKNKSLKFRRVYSPTLGYYLLSTSPITSGSLILSNAEKQIRLVKFPLPRQANMSVESEIEALPSMKSGTNTFIYIVWDTSPEKWYPLIDSKYPNMIFSKCSCTSIIAKNDIPEGQLLTIDYETIPEHLLPLESCNCNEAKFLK